MAEPLHKRIERRIRKIPASHSGFSVATQSDVAQWLDGPLIKCIASEAAKEAQDYFHEQEAAQSAE